MNSHIVRARRRRAEVAFTLIQVLATTAIIVLLAAVSFGYLQRSRRVAQRGACDMHLKALTLAIGSFHQERGEFPTTLWELSGNGYITDRNIMRCPLDPRVDGSYDDFYIFRNGRPVPDDPRDPNSLPIIVCPFHEEDGKVGVQAFRGNTRHYSTMTATLTGANGATVERPGKTPFAARSGMTLYGGDRIRTTGNGTRIRFADGSWADLQANSDVTVLQSFVAGHRSAPLYTLIRQHLGEVLYRVSPGSKFDVATPTATAGALGTRFGVRRIGDEWYLQVTESRVLCNAKDKTGNASGIYSPGKAPQGGRGDQWNRIGRQPVNTGNNGNNANNSNNANKGNN